MENTNAGFFTGTPGSVASTLFYRPDMEKLTTKDEKQEYINMLSSLSVVSTCAARTICP